MIILFGIFHSLKYFIFIFKLITKMNLFNILNDYFEENLKNNLRTCFELHNNLSQINHQKYYLKHFLL
jgi:hypothetical protein